VRSRRAETLVLCGALFLFVVISVLQSNAKRVPPSTPSTYDTGPRGYAALYEFLQRERIDAGRFEMPLGALAAGGTLVVAGDYAVEPVFSARNSATLETWVRKGGRLIVLGAVDSQTRDALGLPRTSPANRALARTGCAFAGKPLSVAGVFQEAALVRCDKTHRVLLANNAETLATVSKHGRGSIVYVVTATIFDNAHLARRDNAPFAYDLFAAGASPQFDEYVHGHDSGRAVLQVLPVPVLAASALALFALLLAVIGASVRLAPPRRDLPEDRRDSFAYIESLARMLQRGGAADDTIARLSKAAAALRRPAPGDESGRKAFGELRALQQQRGASPRDVLRAGVIFNRLRKDYEW
jgi:hypothetical protein